jgi:hypothetical protein
VKRWGPGVLVPLVACGQIHEETRVERGALLRSFERDTPPTPSGVRVHAQAEWPRLTLSFSTFEICRHERVDEYAEEHITDTTAPSAGSAMASGVSTTLIGLGLFLARGLFSNAPDTRTIDGGGRYGSSDRTNATVWSYGLMLAGGPALAIGAFELVQTGERVKTQRVEEVSSAKELPCNEHPVDGRVELSSLQAGAPKVFQTQGGVLVLEDSQLRGVPVGAVTFEGKPALLSSDEQPVVERYLACLKVPSAADLPHAADWPRAQLEAALDDAHECEGLSSGPAREALPLLQAELDRRIAGPVGPQQGPRISSFEEALAAYSPNLRFAPGGDAASRLSDGSIPQGTAVYLQAILIERLEANIALLDLKGLHVLLFIPSQAAWGASLDNGSRVEVVGVFQAVETLGVIQGPLIRAVWARPSM